MLSMMVADALENIVTRLQSQKIFGIENLRVHTSGNGGDLLCGGMPLRPLGRGGGLTSLGRTEGQKRDLFSVMKRCFGLSSVMSHQYTV
jgi:hypothetical protein